MVATASLLAALSARLESASPQAAALYWPPQALVTMGSAYQRAGLPLPRSLKAQLKLVVPAAASRRS